MMYVSKHYFLGLLLSQHRSPPRDSLLPMRFHPNRPLPALQVPSELDSRKVKLNVELMSRLPEYKQRSHCFTRPPKELRWLTLRQRVEKSKSHEAHLFTLEPSQQTDPRDLPRIPQIYLRSRRMVRYSAMMGTVWKRNGLHLPQRFIERHPRRLWTSKWNSHSLRMRFWQVRVF